MLIVEERRGGNSRKQHKVRALSFEVRDAFDFSG
jgi:hypothetical protein